MYLLQLDEGESDPFCAHTGLMDDHPIGIVTFGGHSHRVNQPPYDPANRHLRG